MLYVVILNAIILNMLMPNVNKLNVITPGIIMPNVNALNVAAPFQIPN